MSDIDFPPDAAVSDVSLKGTSALLGSRLCHDLISPLGAISNGLELLAMSGHPPSAEMKLIEESVENANNRIRFFRVAFGGASAAQRMARGDIVKLIAGCYAGGRIAVKWQVMPDCSRVETKLALLSILCMESGLPAGGEIIIAEERGEWQIHAYGSKIRFDPDCWNTVNGRATEDLSSAQVQFALLRDALETLGRKPQIGHSDSAISLMY